MALKTYVGARYAPQFMGAWDKSSEYAALSVVYTNDRSFVSRKTVPANTDILNTEYWIQSSDWNAQVAEYNELVQQYHDATEEYNKNVEAYNTAVSKFYADTLHSYRTKAEMVADASLKLEDTVLTCGDKAIGDTGGSFYRIVDKTSSKAVALENGLFAEPFEFQPYDYSEFATKTDEYKAQTDEQIQQYKETTDQQIQAVQNDFDQKYTDIKNVSLNTYNTVNDMQADTSLTANTTVLTTGEASIGDNLGSFYRVQDSSSRQDAVPLNNGKKAVPFVVEGGLASGSQLNFLGQANVPNVWNVKAPSNTSINVTVTNGGTSTVFIAILYTSTSTQSVNISININSGNIRSITLSDSASANNYKTVIYGITVRWNGERYYYGYAAVASWVNQFTADTITVTQKLPANAPQPDGTVSHPNTSYFTVAVPITLNYIITNFSKDNSSDITVGSNRVELNQYNSSTGKYDIELYKNVSVPKGTYQHNINKTLNPGTVYAISISRLVTASDLSTFYTYTCDTALASGTYGDINVQSSPALGYTSFVANYTK